MCLSLSGDGKVIKEAVSILAKPWAEPRLTYQRYLPAPSPAEYVAKSARGFFKLSTCWVVCGKFSSRSDQHPHSLI